MSGLSLHSRSTSPHGGPMLEARRGSCAEGQGKGDPRRCRRWRGSGWSRGTSRGRPWSASVASAPRSPPPAALSVLLVAFSSHPDSRRSFIRAGGPDRRQNLGGRPQTEGTAEQGRGEAGGGMGLRSRLCSPQRRAVCRMNAQGRCWWPVNGSCCREPARTSLIVDSRLVFVLTPFPVPTLGCETRESGPVWGLLGFLH